jgi:hypothetical protein
MHLLNPTCIEDWIVAALQQGSLRTIDLLERVRLSRGSTTKQGFYAALRALKRQEVIVVYKKTAALNTTWIRRMITFLNEASYANTGSRETVDLLALEEKESLSYTFSSTRHLDIFWGHSQNILLQATPPTEAVYAYDPHYWFYLARKKTEEQLLSEITTHRRQFLMTVGGRGPLDRAIQSDFNTDLLQYNLEPLFSSSNYYVVVIGDYITEVFLDPVIAKKIESIYASASEINETISAELEELLSVRSRNRIRITRNHTKAMTLKRRLGKNFYIRT